MATIARVRPKPAWGLTLLERTQLIRQIRRARTQEDLRECLIHLVQLLPEQPFPERVEKTLKTTRR